MLAEIVSMRRVEELSQKEVAARLGIGDAIVEIQVAKAMRRLADALFGCQGGEEPKSRRGTPGQRGPLCAGADK